MINRLVIPFLTVVMLNLLMYSSSFARNDQVSAIIKARIEALMTTGKLSIGYSDIASKIWLPDLYQRNGFQQLWQDPQNVEDLLNEIGFEKIS